MKSFSSNRKTTRVNRSRRSISLVVVTTLLCTLLAGVLSKIASVKASASASFAPATSFAMGASPTGVVVGDFNKDGKPDVVTANSGSNNISLRAGDGSGGFGSAANFNVATSPSSVAVGDFNKDGNLDLVTANAGSNNVSVLLGNGSGSFAAAVNFNVASNPSSVAVGDFNNDGNPDIVTANSNDNNVSILLGNGNGGFSAAVNFAVGMQPSSVVIGDFNGDSKLDIATANLGSNDISILLGNGSGGFSAANNFNSGGTGPRSIAIGDFNRDGLYDLVVTNRSSNNVSILLGNGVGSFGAASNFNVGSNPTSVVVADFNQDGIPDLAVANNSSNTTSILLGNGTGGFGASSDFNVGTGPIAAAVGDFNADGKPDLVIANANSNDASMLLNTNTATPISQPEFVSGNKLTTGPALNLTEAPDQIVTADFNNDGIPDLAVLNNLGAVAIFLGKGDGTFGTRITLPSGGVSFSFAIGDFNRDGKLDIVTGNQNNTVSVFLGNGTGSFGFPSNITTNGGANYVAVGDFNGDGNLDIAAGHEQNTLTSTTISIMLGTGTGTFGPSTDFNAGKSVFAIAVGDFNQDGKIDLATADLQRGSVEILLGNGNGRFGFPNSFSASDGPISIAVADFNGDGKQDLVVGDAVDQKISILIGSGTGTFGLPTFSSTNNASSVIASGDFNGDGKLDVAVPNRSDGTVSVILGTGTGTFGSPITFLSGGGPAAVGVGDFNRDGLLDLVVANSIDDNVSVLLGANPGPDSNLGIIQINGGANPQVGLPFSLIVQSQDSNGVPSNVVNDTTVTLSVNTGTGSLSGNLTGIIKSGTNYATISGVIYGKSGNGVSLTVSRTSGDNLSAGHSPQFTVNQATGISADPAGVCLGNTPCLTDIQAAIESTLPGGSVLVYPGQYNSSVIVDQPLTVEFTGNVVLNDLSIESSGATVMDSGTISLRGNFNHDLGNFFTLMGTVSFIGSDTTSKQRINGSQQTSFANLVINNTGAGVMIQGSDKVVNLVLTLDTNLDTNGFKLIMPETAASVGSADVIGDVVRTNIGDAPLGTKLSFGNPFNTISIDSGSQPSQITVRLTEITPNDASTGQTNSGFSNAVERTYVITPNGGSGFSATVQLHYLTADLNGNDPNTLHLWRFNSSSGQWEDKGADTQDTVNQSVTKSGITAFSPWTLSSAVTPTAVNFESFTATSEAGAVSLRWNTGFEVNNFGFNIYREVNGQRVKVNPSLIAGSALMVGSNVKVKAGSGYYWQDETNNVGASYWLEDVDINGTSSWHGPFGISSSPSSSIGRGRRTKSVLLNNLNVGRAGTAQSGAVVSDPSILRREYPADFAVDQETTTQTSVVTKGRTPTKPAPISATQQKQWLIASQPAVKIAINQSGWYHLNMTDLMTAGLNPGANPQTLQMFVGGKEVPIKINLSNPAMLSAGDSIEFYGSALNTPTTNTQVYWLVSGSQMGKRIGVEQSPATTNANNQNSFPYTVEMKERSIYFSSLLNGDAENWFGKVINGSPASEVVTIHDRDVTSNGQAQLEVGLQGVTTGEHQVMVMMNGQPLNTITFTGQTHQVSKISIPESSLEEGDNNITFTAQNSSDVSLFDYVRVTYAHTYSAVNNNLFTSVPAMQPVIIGGFTSNQIMAFDIANPNQPVEIAGTISGDNNNYSIGLGPSSKRDLLVLTPDQMLQPISITANQPSSLNRETTGANFVVVTYKDFAQSIQPFVALKQSQGFKVAVVDVETIYDEFSYGVHTPQALKDFLSWTYLHWPTQPQYVLLAGSASLDPKNYTGIGFQDFVPTKLIDTASMETASDDYLVDFNNDGQPQMSIGRLPVRTSDEMATVVNKIITFEQSGAAQSVVLVSDLNDGVDFSSSNNQIKSAVPAGFNTVSIVRGQTNTDAKTELMDQLSQGGKIVNYSGHGSVTLWRGNLLTDADVQTLAGKKASPLVVTMTCLNAYFQDPHTASLGESLIKVNQGGAVSVWASSAMTDSGQQSTMDRELFRQLFGNPNITLGEAIRQAKKITTDNDIRRTWILFGDPTMTIRIQN